ncbi:hypothetical protein D3C73_905020 [compost metagenome]
MLRQTADQSLADPRLCRLGIDRQAPEGCAVLRILEGASVVHTRHRADHRSGRQVLRDEIGEGPVVAMRPEEIRRRLHHATLGVDIIDRLGVRFRHQTANGEAPRLTAAGPIGRQVQPIGMGRIEEQLLRRRGQQDVGIADVEGDVAAIRPLRAQSLDQRRGGLEGLGEQKAAPAAVKDGIAHGLTSRGHGRFEAFMTHAFQPVRLGTRETKIRRHVAASTSRGRRPATAPNHAKG